LVRKTGAGHFYLKDSQNRPCVFVYTPIPETQWFCISCVPLASFKNGTSDITYTLILFGLLVALLAFNVAWLLYSNHRFRIIAQREREASSAKTDFLSRMSHDIRTPLNVVIGSTVLAHREDNPPETQGYLENIDRRGRFLLSLVNDILDLNKVESGKMELYPVPYSLSQFCMNIQAIIKPLCQEKEIDFTIEGTEPGVSFLLDSVRFDQIFFNLLSNSVKFTPSGGHVALRYRVGAMPDGRAKLELDVIDDGVGMSKEFQGQMFESFSQEREGDTAKIEGTGLGLAIVKSLVNLMDGTISVESTLGQGTAFHLTIPAETAPDRNKAEDSGVIDAKSVKGKRVLLFEDNDVNAQIAMTLLEQEGVIVERASDGVEGLEKFTASAPRFYDAILMDLRMPRMDGFQAARAIRASGHDDAATIPIIAMTANAYDEDVRKCLEAGMNAHLSKPVDPVALFSKLAHEIQRAKHMRQP
jgi:signal transduction histidine kinase/AmiR/NasT family two-component response regulator